MLYSELSLIFKLCFWRLLSRRLWWWIAMTIWIPAFAGMTVGPAFTGMTEGMTGSGVVK